MRDEYDFSDAKKRPEVARSLGAKKAVTIRLDEQVIDYFRDLGKETGDPYQTLINSFLRDCVEKKMRPTGEWSFTSGKRKTAKVKRTAAKKTARKKSAGAK